MVIYMDDAKVIEIKSQRKPQMVFSRFIDGKIERDNQKKVF
jgi:hypothetical protein